MIRVIKLIAYSFPLLALCLSIPVYKCSAQTDHGLVTYKLGTDTTVSQYFEFDKRKFTTTIITLTGQIQKYEGIGELDDNGDINKVQSKTSRLDSTGNWYIVSEGTYTSVGDSTIYTSTANGKVAFRRAMIAKGIVANGTDPSSFYVFPYMGFFAPSKIGDTLFHCQLSFGECRKFQVARLGKSELKIGSNVMGRIKMFVDSKERMTGADAIGSSLNFVASVERDKKDYPAYLDQLAKRRFAKGELAPRTLRDTAVALIDGKKIEVDYWKPLRRDRTIFGAVVPWNRIWRMGANNSTQLRTPFNLKLNGNLLPAGKYSLWIYPTETSWQLIFNKKADVWGTEYDSTADLFRVPMIVEKSNQLVEALKISLIPKGEKIVRLLLEWEYQKAFVDLLIE